jgi:hypothetical protein
MAAIKPVKSKKGRPGLTAEGYQARLDAYCVLYGVSVTPEGIPPFPSGRRETAQHREWIALYKAHRRLVESRGTKKPTG